MLEVFPDVYFAHMSTKVKLLVEQATADFARRGRDMDDAQLWEVARADFQLQAEMETLDAGFIKDDLQSWET